MGLGCDISELYETLLRITDLKPKKDGICLAWEGDEYTIALDKNSRVIEFRLESGTFYSILEGYYLVNVAGSILVSDEDPEEFIKKVLNYIIYQWEL